VTDDDIGRLIEEKNRIVRENFALLAENARLRRGDFTPEEFQAVCHHRDDKPGCTRADFEAGCLAYQRQLFGPPAGAATK
jgi:hypothetical protein